ncbi:MAG: hypothetical protein NWQ54_21205 [Paraglaciecola sp.]|nr:hypothetical protein [Paraglaciecola sp.]
MKGLQRQLMVKQREIGELKAENEQLKKQNVSNRVTPKHLLYFLLEAVVVVLLVSLGASAIKNGLATIFYPCNGNLCGQLKVTGAVRFVIGAILIKFAAVITL